MCLNCLFVISNSSQSFDSFLKTLLKEDALKEMDLPYLSSYLYNKMEKKDFESTWIQQANKPDLKKHNGPREDSRMREMPSDYHYGSGKHRMPHP
jgi:hypothetical protein